jgi:hypothetical protein
LILESCALENIRISANNEKVSANAGEKNTV